MTEIILDSVVSVKPKAEIVSVSLKPSACKHPGSPTLCLSLVSKETKLRAVVCFSLSASLQDEPKYCVFSLRVSGGCFVKWHNNNSSMDVIWTRISSAVLCVWTFSRNQ